MCTTLPDPLSSRTASSSRSSLVVRRRGTKSDEIKVDAVGDCDDTLDHFDSVLHRVRLSAHPLRQVVPMRTYLEQSHFNLSVVHRRVATSVELDQVAFVLDKGDKVEIHLGIEVGSLQMRTRE